MSVRTRLHHYQETHPDRLLNAIVYALAFGFLAYFCVWAIDAMRLW